MLKNDKFYFFIVVVKLTKMTYLPMTGSDHKQNYTHSFSLFSEYKKYGSGYILRVKL